MSNRTPKEAVRKALEDVLEKIDRWRMDGVMEHWQYSQLFDIADSALAAPARQCDVGTAEEQTERYRKFCFAHRYLGSDFSYTCKGFGKGRCPFFNSHTKSKCEFEWAQTPYAEEGGAK